MPWFGFFQSLLSHYILWHQDCNNCYNHVTHYHDITWSHPVTSVVCCHDPILFNHVILPYHIPEPLCTLTHTPDPDMLCCILVVHSDKHKFLPLCIAPAQNYIHSFTYLALSPLWSYAPMLSPCYMFPSVCFMLTFLVAPRISLILLWIPIWFVLVFKPLVFTHVPSSNIVNYCCITSPLSVLLSDPSLLSPIRLSIPALWNSRTCWCKRHNLCRLKPKFSTCTKSSLSCSFIRCYELNQREGKTVSAHWARSCDRDLMDRTRTRRLSAMGELWLQPTKVAPLAPTCSRISGKAGN